MPLAPRVLAQQSPATQDDRLSWVGCQPVAPHTPSRKVLILPTPYTTRTGDMHDPATQLRRMPLPRTPVNRGKGLYKKYNASMTNGREQGSGDRQMAESQLSELQNMRVLLEEARGLSRDLAYHRRARLEARLGEALEEVDRQIAELRAAKG